MRKRKPRLKVIFEKIRIRDAEERLLKAYEMLLGTPFPKEGIDKKPARDKHKANP
jgi:hypothetical protein